MCLTVLKIEPHTVLGMMSLSLAHPHEQCPPLSADRPAFLARICGHCPFVWTFGVFAHLSADRGVHHQTNVSLMSADTVFSFGRDLCSFVWRRRDGESFIK